MDASATALPLLSLRLLVVVAEEVCGGALVVLLLLLLLPFLVEDDAMVGLIGWRVWMLQIFLVVVVAEVEVTDFCSEKLQISFFFPF